MSIMMMLLIPRYEEQYKSCMTTKQDYFPGHLRCMPNGNYDPAQCIAQVLPLILSKPKAILNTTKVNPKLQLGLVRL